MILKYDGIFIIPIPITIIIYGNQISFCRGSPATWWVLLLNIQPMPCCGPLGNYYIHSMKSNRVLQFSAFGGFGFSRRWTCCGCLGKGKFRSLLGTQRGVQHHNDLEWTLAAAIIGKESIVSLCIQPCVSLTTHDILQNTVSQEVFTSHYYDVDPLLTTWKESIYVLPQTTVLLNVARGKQEQIQLHWDIQENLGRTIVVNPELD